MDSFIRLIAIYRAASRIWAAKQIYKRASSRLKFGLWASKAAFLTFEVLLFANLPFFSFFFSGVLVSAVSWAICVFLARKSAFSEEYRLYSDRIQHFYRDYQYLRYLRFRNDLQEGKYSGSIDDALRFLDEQESTEIDSKISIHPLITFLITGLVALMGVAAAHWSVEVLLYVSLFAVLGLWLGGMVIGSIRTSKSELMEFKRFLLWAKYEPLDSEQSMPYQDESSLRR